MLSEMSIELFDEWYEHYLSQPFGHEIESVRHAETCVALYNGLIPKKEGIHEFKDFVHVLEKPEKAQTDPDSDEGMTEEEMMALVSSRFGDTNNGK